MNNREKDYILRVLFITCSAAPADIQFECIGSTPWIIADKLENQGIKISFVKVLPYWPLRRRCREATSGITCKSMRNSLASTEIYEIHWPVLALRSASESRRFWPGAGFAFPFACSTLVAIMQSRACDILLADDLEFSGHIAWRLKEITGVPYVIKDDSSQNVTRCAQGTARHRRLGAIQRDAEFVLDFNAADMTNRTSLFPGIRSRIIITPEPTPSASIAEISKADAISRLGKILHDAVRQSTEIFAW